MGQIICVLRSGTRQHELGVVKWEYTQSDGETRHHAGFPIVQESYLITICVGGMDWYQSRLLGRRPKQGL
jgi:hypothetical protein